jgi:GNAT superfamily N-acetyltransferase
MDIRAAREDDAAAMAALFAAHHVEALSEKQRAEQGFVQGSLDEDTLRAMAGAGALLVAEDAGRPAGVLMLSDAQGVPEPPPPVAALLDRQETLLWDDRPLSAVRWLLYGPVVVDAAHRGRGVARALYDMALEVARHRHAEAVVAFIEAANRLSWHVHVDGFGMHLLGDFTLDGRTYHILASPTHPAAPPP